jgi:2-polyprenyl-3-methyl-5-hydroxy-6-metoxy-1,4-benzoquinol methylase
MGHQAAAGRLVYKHQSFPFHRMQAHSPHYYSNVNPSLLDVVDPSAQRIAEFGCGAGALARAVRQRCSPGLHYVGIELMPDALADAHDALDVGLVRNLDQIPDWSLDGELWAALQPAHFDHVIFGDVLEHLYHPDRVLQQAVGRLRPGGSALVCIPNVQHWSVMAQLIRGHWPQQDAGLFDRTHIRWFALTDMVRLLEGAGLVVEKVIPRIFKPENGQALLQALQPAAQMLGVDPRQFMQRSQPLQYVLVGRKPAS